MEQLNCYLCRERVPGSLDDLATHFINVHGLTINRGVGLSGFECAQDGCGRRFLNFHGLRRHIRKNHLMETEKNPGNNHGPNEITDQEMDEGNEFDHPINLIADDSVICDSDDNEENKFDLRIHIIKMIGKFQCKGSMTGKIITEVLEECEDLLFQMMDSLKKKVRSFLDEKGLLNDVGANGLLETFDLNDPFHGLKTLDEQVEALKKHCGYIEPIEIPLGYRMNDHLDKQSGTYIPQMVMETMQYVPIISTLQMVISSPEVRKAILNERKSCGDELSSFLDGEHAMIHPLFSSYPSALRIQLYYDELEIVNPLGSKTGVHKLGAFYYTIQNLPSHMNSDLNSIHVLLLCCDADVKKYGFKKILDPFLDDLKKLESDEGIMVETGNDEFIDGSTFLELTENDFKQLKIKMGPQKKLLKLINSMKESNLVGTYLFESVSETTDCGQKTSKPVDELNQQFLSNARPHCSKETVELSTPDLEIFSKYGTVEGTLREHPQGSQVLEATRKHFSEESRRMLIRIVVGELVKVHGSCYPPNEAKTALARAIVEEFPLLKNCHSSDGYEHYYDPNSKRGFIEYRLFTLRKNLSPSSKKYQTSKSKSVAQSTNQSASVIFDSGLSQEEIDERISKLKHKNPTELNKKIIISYLAETFNFRRQWIKSSQPTISEIFNTYPRLIDYHGEMIDIEFTKMFPESAENFSAKFPTFYSPRILAYAKKFRPAIYEASRIVENEDLRALAVLVELLPVSNALKGDKTKTKDTRASKGKKQQLQQATKTGIDNTDASLKMDFPNGSLMKFVPEGTNLPLYEEQLRQEEHENIQPYLIFVQGQSQSAKFVQGDSWFIQVYEKAEPVVAFDLLFKTYYTLNLEFPKTLANFFNFVERYIYQIKGIEPRSAVSSLHINISNVEYGIDANENNND